MSPRLSVPLTWPVPRIVNAVELLHPASHSSELCWCAEAASDPHGGVELVFLHNTEQLMSADLDVLLAELPASEASRITCLHRHVDRVNSAICWVWVRRVLGRVFRLAPVDVPCIIGRHGKPSLDGSLLTGKPWHFNISHTRNAALLALSSRAPVGVDLEWLDPQLPWRDITGICMTREQQRGLASLSEDQCREHVLQHWCEMEARLKASGHGLSALEQPRPDGPGPICMPVLLPAGYVGCCAVVPP